jgi:hypothetical protein
MTGKRLVLLVEGHGDVEAVPILVKRLLVEYSAFDAVLLDSKPLRVGEYSKVSRCNFGEWQRFLKVAAKRKDCGGCLLLLDGDSQTKVDGAPFCAWRAARRLAEEARKVGGGTLFSVAIVFACMEFESWLIAGAESLAGRSFSRGRRELPDAIEPLPPNPELNPRDAKGWFKKRVMNGYNPARDQGELTRLVDVDLIRQKGMRSFQRLESATKALVDAIRSGQPSVTPT